MQKNIIGKAVSEDNLKDSPLYQSPLESMLDFTGNIINVNVNGNTETEFSLLANYPPRKMQLLYSINWDEQYNSYEMMGISADFQTWLGDFDVKSGSYGLLFYFYGNDATSLDESSEIPIGDNNNTNGYVYTLNTNDILGNPYHFESYFTTEKVIDLSNMSNVKKLEIYFYQNNDFVNYEDVLIPYKGEENEEFSESYIANLNDNLFVNNIKLYLGYPLNAFSGDTLKLTTDNLTYSVLDQTGVRNLSLKWIHPIEKNKYILLDSSADCELYWVKDGETQQTISKIVGNYWNEQNIVVDATNPFSATLVLNDGTVDLTDKVETRVKVVGRIKKEDGNWGQYESNILTFISTDLRADQTTLDAATGLSIQCMDESQGVYLMYNQNSEIINKGQGEGYNRTLEIYYKNHKLVDSEIKDNIREVRWNLPINTKTNNSYTMLSYSSEELKDSNQTNINQDDLTQNLFIRKLASAINNYKQNYSILNNWYISNTHNTVSCEVELKNGDTYIASRELFFGKANSQGSNISLIIQYKDNKNAYEIKTNNENYIMEKPSMTLKALAYDLSGKLLPSSYGPTGITPVSLWNWSIEPNDGQFSISPSSAETAPDEAVLTLTSAVNTLDDSFNKYHIVKASYKMKDADEEKEIKWIDVYFPISIKTIDENGIARCQAMEGAREIIYNSQGTPQYYTDIYKLLNSNNEEVLGLNWQRYPNDQLGPTLKEISRDGKTYKALLANPIYVKDNEYKTYVIAEKDGIIYWIQPILIMQSQYDFSVVNNWNGSVMVGESSIVSAMIAAGKKGEEDGTFSGVVIGDVSDAGLKGQIGLYGISQGDITFSLTENGLASFEHLEKDNQNSIVNHTQVFLGNDNYILSHTNPTFDNEGNEIGCNNCFLIDIDDRNILLKKDSSKLSGIHMSTGSPYLSLNNDDGNSMLLFNYNNDTNSTNFILQTPGFSDTKGLQFDIKNGIITVNNGDVKLSKGDNFIGRVDNGTNLLKLGSLRVDKSGEVYYGSKTLDAYIREIAESIVAETQ